MQGQHLQGSPDPGSSGHQTSLLLLTEVEDNDSGYIPEVHCSDLPVDLQHKFYRNGRCFKSYITAARTEDILKISSRSSIVSISVMNFKKDNKRCLHKGTLISSSISETDGLLNAKFSRHTNKRFLPKIESLPKISFKIPQETGRPNARESTAGKKLCSFVRSFTQREFSLQDPENAFKHIPTEQAYPTPTQTCIPTLIHVKAKEPEEVLGEHQAAGISTTDGEKSDHVTEDARPRRASGRQLWDKVGVKFGLRRNVGAEDTGENVGDACPVWVCGPGGTLRPAYDRWGTRRDALADPERMCMPQAVRERVQSDVENRKRSVVRKMSHFFNIKLRLNLEEDLHF